MKRTLQTIVAILGFSSFISAQSGVTIQYNGTGPNLAGSSHDFNLYATHPDLVAGGGTIDVHFTVTNNTGVDKQWQIVRKLVDVPSNWSDQVCWPPTCYTNLAPNYGDDWRSPNTGGSPAPIIVDGTSTTTNAELAELKPKITPNQSTGSFAHYRYYIHSGGVNVDSVDLKINFVLATNEIKQAPQIALGPNPANEYVKITGLTADSYKLKVVDVLGNTVHIETIFTENKTLNVEEFKNGVYFIILESSGEKAITKRLVIRH